MPINLKFENILLDLIILAAIALIDYILFFKLKKFIINSNQLEVFLPKDYLNQLKNKLNLANLREIDNLLQVVNIKLANIFLILILLDLNLLSLFINVVIFFVPDFWLILTINKRYQSIKEELPKKIDLLLLCIESGLSIDSALEKILPSDFKNLTPLEQELHYLNKDFLLGLSREKALENLNLRTQIFEIKSFVSSLNQSYRLGISISQVLKNQSQLMTNKFSHEIEEKAHKLPIIMAFPLWFFIMPALMIVVLGPSIINFINNVNQLH